MLIMPINKSLAQQNKATKRLECVWRQVILMCIIEEQQAKKKNPTFEELAFIMRENNWIVVRWPNYNARIASQDYGQLMDLVKDDDE